MNGVDNLKLSRRFYFEYPKRLPWVNSDAVSRKSFRPAISETVSRNLGALLDALDIFHALRGKFAWLGNSETVSRKSVGTYEEPTIRKFRIVGLEAAMGLKNDLSRWNLP